MLKKLFAVNGRKTWEDLVAIAREANIRLILHLQRYLDDPGNWHREYNPVFLTGSTAGMRTRVTSLFRLQMRDFHPYLTLAVYSAGQFARTFGIRAGMKVNERLSTVGNVDVLILREIGNLAGNDIVLQRLHTIINTRRERDGLLTLITGAGTREELDKFHDRIMSRLHLGLGGSVSSL